MMPHRLIHDILMLRASSSASGVMISSVLGRRSLSPVLGKEELVTYIKDQGGHNRSVQLMVMSSSVVAAHDDQQQHQWSTIPHELLQLILKRLSSAPDCIRFGAVCKWWQSLLLQSQHLLTPCVPMLLLKVCEGNDPTDRELFDLNSNKLYKLPSLIDAHNKCIIGSSFGWLIMMEYSPDSSFETELFNPITGAHIPLPPATTLDSFDYFNYDAEFPFGVLDKAVMSSNPSLDGECIVMALHGMCLGLTFCRVGDKRWTSLCHESSDNWFDDIICHKGHFYAVRKFETEFSIVTCDFGRDPEIIVVALQPPRYYGNVMGSYLVSSNEELLMVTRLREEDCEYTKFLIDRLDVTTSKWEEVKSLSDQMLFLSRGFSISISAHEMYGCKPNCIYFIDDEDVYRSDCEFHYNIAVYDLEDKKIIPFSPKIQPFRPSSRVWPSPLFWITPAPW